MFSIEYRDTVRNSILAQARNDSRIVAAAVVGSYARGAEDQWSDIDLTFGVEKGYTLPSLLDSWTQYMQQEFAAEVLFDVQRGGTIYRVFLLPGCLQVDLSFSQTEEFGAVGGHFVLLYGSQYPKPQPTPQALEELFGYLVHHLLRARFCTERGRLWQAEYWLTESRNYILKIACRMNGVPADYGRGMDDLPPAFLDSLQHSFVGELDPHELLRCLRLLINALPQIAPAVPQSYARLHHRLRELVI